MFVTQQHLAIVLEHCNGGDLAGLVSKRLRRGVRLLQILVFSDFMSSPAFHMLVSSVRLAGFQAMCSK